MSNEPAERLLQRLDAQWKDSTGAEAELDAALAAERKATVERIRAATLALPSILIEQEEEHFAEIPLILAILDAEAAR